MGKLIIILFAFLALAFYELSGGADFDSEALRLSRVEAGPIQHILPKVTDVATPEGAPKIAPTTIETTKRQ